MQTLFYGGSVITMEQDKTCEAVLVRDGKTEALGSEQQLSKRAPNAQRVHLRGHTLLPAFVDAHGHFYQVASALLQVSLADTADLDEMKQRIAAFVERERFAPGQWVIARDYDPSVHSDGQGLSLSQLDELSPVRPLILQTRSGHMGYLNTKALCALGITPKTPSPKGGRIHVQGGRLTGYVEENAFFECMRRIPPPSDEQMLRALCNAQQIYLSKGITTVQEGLMAPEMERVYKQLLASNTLAVDVVAYAEPSYFKQVIKAFEGTGGGHFKIGGVKIFLDGSPQGRTAWMREPYADDPAYKGYGVLTNEQVTAAITLSARYGVQLTAHCNGDAAAEQFLACLAECEQAFPELQTLRPVIIHGQLVGVDQLPQAKRLGAVVSFFVAHVFHWGDVHVKTFGLERAQRISPAASALGAGVCFTFHQDAPVIAPNMLETLWCATCRQTKSGTALGNEERIPVWDALLAVTKNAAFQAFLEHEKGSIAPGKQADFVLLDHNPLSVAPECLTDVRVLATYKAGACVWQA